jgi:hypothetical protein
MSQLVLSGHGADVYDIKAFTQAEQSLFPAMREINRYVGFFAPPFAIPWLVPIGLIPLPEAIYLWKFSQLIAVASGLLLLSRIFQMGRGTTAWLFAWTLLTSPSYEAARLDQISPLLLLAFSVGLAMLEKKRDIYAGIALACLFLKPQELMPILVILLGLKKYTAVYFTLGWGLIVGIASFFILGIKAFFNYKSFMNIALSSDTILVSNVSSTLRGQLLRFFPNSRHAVEIASAAVLVFGLIAIYFIARRFAGKPDGLKLAMSCALPIGFATCSYLYVYDLLLLLPCLIAFQQMFYKIKKWRGLGYLACICALPFFVPIHIPLHYDYLLKGANINPFFMALLAYSLIVIALMLTNQRQLET